MIAVCESDFKWFAIMMIGVATATAIGAGLSSLGKNPAMDSKIVSLEKRIEALEARK
jgi:hypothetical protein